MLIGVPKEVKDNEYRVGMVPAGVKGLIDAGHKVIVQAHAGALERGVAMHIVQDRFWPGDALVNALPCEQLLPPIISTCPQS